MSAAKRKVSGRQKVLPVDRLLRLVQEQQANCWFDLVTLSGRSEGSCLKIFSEHVLILVNKGSYQDRKFFHELILLLKPTSSYGTTQLLLDCVLYFDQICDAEELLATALICLDQANNVGDRNLIRRSMSLVGVAYLRNCDYENSCSYLKEALEIARESGNALSEFAVLCNIVAVLKSMGLIAEAKNLAKKLQSFPNEGTFFHALHLQNSVNGLSMCLDSEDLEPGNHYHELAEENFRLIESVSLPWRSYVDAENALWLIRTGKASEAQSLILAAYAAPEYGQNFRVTVILACARSSCAIATNDTHEMKFCAGLLADSLPKSALYPVHREDILRSLVEMYRHDPSAFENDAGAVYVDLLHDHVINVKHRQFFERIRREANTAWDADVSLAMPSYELPSVIAGNLKGADAASQSTVGQAVRLACLVDTTPKLGGGGRRQIETPLRTTEYLCAEDWAVAADFGTERGGQQCFQVGALAGLLALRLGFSEEQSVVIEMACRLHDIGKLFVDSKLQKSVNRGKTDDYAVVQRHTVAGSVLLASFEDPVFTLASQVALQHHEWWNGCGYPDALRGEAISVEARICAVADTFVKLVNSSCLHRAWDAGLALKQISTMAAGQFDPRVAAALGELVEDGMSGEVIFSDSYWNSFSGNRVGFAKTQLLNAIN